MALMDKPRVLHAAKRLAGVLKLLQDEIDELLDATGLMDKKLNNKEEKDVNTVTEDNG